MTIDWHARAKELRLKVKNFINGTYVESLGAVTIDKYSSRDGELLYQFTASTVEDLDLAVKNAREAFDDGRWQSLTIYERQSVLNKLADLIEINKEELALYECLDVGKPISNALHDDIPSTIAALKGSADNMDKLLLPSGSDSRILSWRQHKPLGVVGGVVGWNYPLALAAQKLGPALAMGNSLVLKPSEFTSLSACRLAELALEAGVPAGVFNVVNGTGKTVGDALARHDNVDLLTFVGSSATGKHIMKAAGESNMKRLLLECGGKSPYLVFDDCPDNYELVVDDIVETAFPNQGALCVAGTRLIIQEGIKEKLLPMLIEKAKQILAQDPLNPETSFGALMNEAHMKKVMAYINSGQQQGAELVCGGRQINSEGGGFYIAPTIFDSVQPAHKIAQEEIFGPVLSILTFKNEEEAVKLANDSCYGLAAYVATENASRIHRLSQQLRAGTINIMCTPTPVLGGVAISSEGDKQSGFGFEGGIEGLKAYSASSTINLYF